MLNKVEICGVNTSRLEVLTNDETNRLLKACKEGDKAAREKLVQGNLRLVLSVIQRFTNRGEMVDDLFQVGCIGLIKSIDNFDLSQNVRFSTYAVPMIIGELRRYLRDNSAIRVSRSMRDTAYRAMQVKERFMNANQREPTIDELAKEMDLPREEIVFALDAIVEPVSRMRNGSGARHREYGRKLARKDCPARRDGTPFRAGKAYSVSPLL